MFASFACGRSHQESSAASLQLGPRFPPSRKISQLLWKDSKVRLARSSEEGGQKSEKELQSRETNLILAQESGCYSCCIVCYPDAATPGIKPR
jgi:hypothetical protein